METLILSDNIGEDIIPETFDSVRIIRPSQAGTESLEPVVAVLTGLRKQDGLDRGTVDKDSQNIFVGHLGEILDIWPMHSLKEYNLTSRPRRTVKNCCGGSPLV